MAGYLSPGAYFYPEEQEYLQAYEDVLERYKGPLRSVFNKTVAEKHLLSFGIFVAISVANIVNVLLEIWMYD
ncbi:hypothetical protein BTVI_72566 [Pitangus sulphuratus]|nr:hypothetical protein BTVI_72566 [Pitangus sulphuratus]